MRSWHWDGLGLVDEPGLAAMALAVNRKVDSVDFASPGFMLCGSVVETPTSLLEFELLLPFRCQPRFVDHFSGKSKVWTFRQFSAVSIPTWSRTETRTKTCGALAYF